MKTLNLLKINILTILTILITGMATAQTIVYQENFGNPVDNPKIQDYTGWQNTNVLYTGDGTCDLRTSYASEDYGLASGSGNVMINDTVKWFMISQLNTLNYTNLSIYCGLRKKSTADNGSDFVIEVSSDSIAWTRLDMQDSLPTGTGTTGWHRVRFQNVPSCENLHIRFSSSAKTDYRIDDVHLVEGEETVLETVETPTITPAGGTYYETQHVDVATATPDAVLYYTLDGTAPDEHSNHYVGSITINSSSTLKVLAVKAGMYNSAIATANYIILDTNSLVTLPLDLSTNSSVEHSDITQQPGFRAFRLGTSYSDGSAKFESANASKAELTAHLNSKPDKLFFDLKGKKGGSSPSAYQDINFLVRESVDGQNWTTVATLSENDISTEDFVQFTDIQLNENTRYISWKLEAASKGNTMLNNIKITKATEEDTTIILDYNYENFAIYPNPTNDKVFFHTGNFEILSVTLHDLTGHELQHWTGECPSYISLSEYKPGTYIITVETTRGIISRKAVRY